MISVLIAILVDDIEDVFSLVGAVASNAIGFVFPAVFYICLINRKDKAKNFRYYISYGIILLYIPMAYFAIVSNFLVES